MQLLQTLIKRVWGEHNLARSLLMHFLLIAVALSFTTTTPCLTPEVIFIGSDRLEPGQKVRITWSRLPPDTEEFELLLKCESPFVFKVRLTECKDPGLDAISWIVPRIPCQRARLLLRRGERGREIDWAWSRPFSIRGGLCAPVQKTAYYRGEFWATDETLPSLWSCGSIITYERTALWGIHKLHSSTDESATRNVRTRHSDCSRCVISIRPLEGTPPDRRPMNLTLRL